MSPVSSKSDTGQVTSRSSRQQLHALLHEALARADRQELVFVAVKIAAAIDELERCGDGG